MAKKESDWAKIVKYGKWLEPFIRCSEYNVWDLKPAFKEAVKLLEIEYYFKEDHPFFLMLNQLSEKRFSWVDVFEEIISYRKDSFFNSAIITFIVLQDTIITARHLLHNFTKDDRPWHISYSEIVNKLQISPTQKDMNSTLIELAELNLLFSYTPVEEEVDDQSPEYIHLSDRYSKIYEIMKDGINKLYSNLGEKLIITPDGCKKVNVLLQPHVKISTYDLHDTHMFTTSDEYYLPLNTLFSRIFFDFLLIGGQDYYGLCKHCNEFYIAERKGRKKFCSDVCRTMNQRNPSSF